MTVPALLAVPALAFAYAAGFLIISASASAGFEALLAAGLALPLIWLSLTDLRRFEIPDGAVLIIAVGGVAFQYFVHPHRWFVELGAAVALMALLWTVGYHLYQRGGREALGIGDAKLIGAGALWTGFADIWLALFLACLGGIIAALARKPFGLSEVPREIPFGPFLAYAIYLVFLLQISSVSWY